MFRAQTVSSVLLDLSALALCALVLFWGLGTLPIRDNNEALYAEIAKVMAAGGSWIVPHLDGVPYIEKPPLLYWLTAISFKLFGIGAWQARLPSALAAWLLCVALLAFGRQLGAPRAGRVAALVAGTAFGYTLIARTILFDTLMVAFWVVALGCWFIAVQRRQRKWLRIAAVSIALSTLSKGPEAVLLLGLVVAWQIVWSPGTWRRAELLKFTLDPLAIGLFLFITAPWMIAAGLQQPGFTWFFFVNETIMRFLGKRIPDDYHAGPWWYYGPKLVLGVFQWIPVVIALALAARPAQRARAQGPLCLDLKRSGQLALTSALLIFAFFSLAQNKGAYYILPVIPLVGWWAGTRVELVADVHRLSRPLMWAALFSIMLVLALWMNETNRTLEQQFKHWGLPKGVSHDLLWMFVSLTGLNLLAAGLWRRRHIEAGFLAFALLAWPMLHFTNQIELIKSSSISQAEIVRTLHASLPPRTQMYSWQTFEDVDASLLFYGFRPLHIIDSKSADLWFGCAADGKNSPCIGMRAFRAAREASPVAVWVARDRLKSWLATGAAAGMQRLEFAHCVVFVNSASRVGGTGAAGNFATSNGQNQDNRAHPP